jgi:hypothetical protein
MALRKIKELEFERESTGSDCLENFLWKRLWTCRETDNIMNELSYILVRQVCSCGSAYTHVVGTLAQRRLVLCLRESIEIRWQKEPQHVGMCCSFGCLRHC